MLISYITLFLSVANAWRWGRREIFSDLPDSAAVIDALKDPDLYDKLSRLHLAQENTQSAIENIFDEAHKQKSSCGARAACPAYDGETRKINGREYNMYCTNAPWGSYFWLPKARNLGECEQRCHENSYDCNGLTFYPSTGACSIIYSKDAAPYIWDNGYQKIGAIPVKSEVAFGPGMVCPLPGSDNQVYDFDKEKKIRFKMSCRNQFKVDAKARRQLGTVRNVDECGLRCGQEKNCYGFQYYQPAFPGGRVDGARNCEIITEEIGDEDWVPLYRPNQYLSGLRVKHFDCGDIGWNRDEKGDEEEENKHSFSHQADSNRPCRGENRNGRCFDNSRPHHHGPPRRLNEDNDQWDL